MRSLLMVYIIIIIIIIIIIRPIIIIIILILFVASDCVSVNGSVWVSLKSNENSEFGCRKAEIISFRFVQHMF